MSYQDLKAIYPHILDTTKTPYDAGRHERIKIEGLLVIVPIGVCAKCGGERHKLDTRGFCRLCKIDMKLVFPKASEPRPAAPGRHIDPKSDEFQADYLEDKFIDDIWDLIGQEEQAHALRGLWETFPKVLRLKAVKLAIRNRRPLAPAISLPPAVAEPIEVDWQIKKHIGGEASC